MAPKVSIITVTYNAQNTIEATLKSVVEQSYPNKEYIIIDGGSSDGTMELVKKNKDNITYYISEPDLGIYDAMNKAIAKATGEWIIFMNSGDTFVDNNVLNYIFSNSYEDGISVIYGDTIYKYRWGKVLIKVQNPLDLSKGMPFVHQSSLIRSSVIKKYKFNLKYKICADYNLFYNLYYWNYRFIYSNCTISEYENGGYSDSFILKELDEIYEISSFMSKNKYKLYRLLFLIRVKLRNLLPKKIVDYYRRRKYSE